MIALPAFTTLPNASGDEKAAVRLRPSQQLVFDTRTGAMRLTDEPSADRSINWIDGRFCFEHDTFAEIVAELKRYYNVDIRFMDDALRSERFSGDFRVEEIGRASCRERV